ncbi:hypothetical protein EMIHUDRAFT_236678 [Emiliania huxleyi CCMP1516]|uniref:Sulfatase N-terminal domain-containing protein n=2 Tax=Emiliania huxleyi TaxID=2903 RepID=A0A0D3JT00_EMIH1|nr:hypothetical protein EMIHUDRAFT_236678 [Emiliania huxleyi CCMP1516]EOD26635.1 hypothetical protein EMIHUDRAFT_236678 [Emiliania huxleyi CCMP1516]|eukprot:XP_005779064.1 hypothetical protein EMIHUDRAFT_236678 [Emiliania huxleyi CCMP1516]
MLEAQGESVAAAGTTTVAMTGVVLNRAGEALAITNAGSVVCGAALNIDSLAATGVILERHYVYHLCAPTRASTLSGRLPYHVNQRNPNDLNSSAGVDLRMTLLPAKLKAAGYTTSMIGKSHLGTRSVAHLPIRRGFDMHFGFLGGGEDHFTQISGEDPVGELVDLWRDDKPAFGENGTFSGFLYAGEAERVIHAHKKGKDGIRQEMVLAYTDSCTTSAPSGCNAALIQGRYKVVTGHQGGSGFWTGPIHPNTSGPADPKRNLTACGTFSCCDGCLYDIQADPSEHKNLQRAMPALYAQLHARLLALGATEYQTRYIQPGLECITAEQAKRYYRGFRGPPCFGNGQLPQLESLRDVV